MFCRKCGKEIPNDSTFCPKCGAKISLEEALVSATPDEVSVAEMKAAEETIQQLPEEKSADTAIVAVADNKKGVPFMAVLWVLLVIVIAAIAIPVAVTKYNEYTEAHHEFEYHLVENYGGYSSKKGYVIDNYVGKEKDVIIPNTINKLPVFEIGEKAFTGTDIESLMTNANLTRIGKSAFENCHDLKSADLKACHGTPFFEIADFAFSYCTALENVAMSDRFTNVGMRAFQKCESLETIDLEHVNSFGSMAFAESGLRNVEPNGFDGNGELGALGVFADCKDLESVTIYTYFSYIPEEAFLRCENLKTVTWWINENGSDPVIHRGAFSGCTSLEKFVLNDGKAAVCPKELEGITVEDDAFQGCDNFKDPEPTTKHNEWAASVYIGKTFRQAVDMAYSYDEIGGLGTVDTVLYDPAGRMHFVGSISYDGPNTIIEGIEAWDEGRYFTSDTGKTDFVYVGMTAREMFEYVGEHEIESWYEQISGNMYYTISFDMYGYHFYVYLSGATLDSTITSVAIGLQ